jgi:hypothetical protein
VASTAVERKAKEVAIKKSKGFSRHYFWLDQESVKKLHLIRDESGLTLSEIVNNLIKGGK